MLNSDCVNTMLVEKVIFKFNGCVKLLASTRFKSMSKYHKTRKQKKRKRTSRCVWQKSHRFNMHKFQTSFSNVPLTFVKTRYCSFDKSNMLHACSALPLLPGTHLLLFEQYFSQFHSNRRSFNSHQSASFAAKLNYSSCNRHVIHIPFACNSTTSPSKRTTAITHTFHIHHFHIAHQSTK